MPSDNVAATPAAKETGQAETPETSSSVENTTGLPDISAADILRSAGVPEEAVNALDARAGQADKEAKPSTPDEPEQKSSEQEAQATEPAVEGEAQTATEEAEPETEEVAEEEDKDEEPEEEPEPAEDKQPDWFQKRLAKWKRKQERMQDEIDDLKATVEGKAKAEPPATTLPPGADPMSTLETMEQLQYAVQKQRQIRDWCMENPDGAVFNEGKENETVVTPEEVRRTLVQATRVIEDAPRRAGEIRQQQQMRQLVSNEWPELYDKGSEVYATSQQFLKENPSIAMSPNRDLILGLMLEGWKPFQARMLARQQGQQQQNGEKSTVPEALKRKIPPIPKTTAPNPPRGNRVHTPVNDAAAAVNRIATQGASPENIQDAIAAIERQNAVLGGTKRTPAPA